MEDFSYPSAASILANKGIRLIRGDGKLVLADCDDNAQQIRVLTKADPSVNRAGTYCFAAKASSGYLSLELPRVFYFETTDRPISADLTADGKTTTVDVAKDSFKPVGEGVVNGAHSTLVELRVTG
ncbi:hypothetical protein [Streptomyces sp. NPDC016845]|uniref:hypothetical protein n=1 Tax=Streptomyces sp. NPDC016845 TaxID=3364972 RepID=UPI0037ACC1C5